MKSKRSIYKPTKEEMIIGLIGTSQIEGINLSYLQAKDIYESVIKNNQKQRK